MEILESPYELAVESLSVYFPTSKRKKQAFLEKARKKADYYKPRIEEKSGLYLGKVGVKDNQEWLSDVASFIANKSAVENAWKQGRVPTEGDYRVNYAFVSLMESIVAFPLWLYNSFHGCEMRHQNNTIYLPFYYIHRLVDPDFKKRTDNLDYTIVHELSHAVWGRIAGGDKGKPFFEWRQLFEGFATYCADNYFAEFYPEGAKTNFDGLPKSYINGKKKIEKLVEKYGEEIVLEVPKRWKELSTKPPTI